ncbi:MULTISPECIES: carbohydrate deacetylase [unclassified Enterococcus]|uniref:carbohydrate deacetylase n=1 Tax=unclassified Enterococcus TaxID=2608891 RepID=UPI0013EBA277|nr:MULTISPECIES: carbohydrate deacetylase [unclassified Enterococcus]
MGKVIFNSDDFGYSHGVNYGIVEAHRRGILTSTTLMANMPGFQHAVTLKKDWPQLAVGVHLTLTCGKPLIPKVDSLMEGTQFKKLSFYEKDFEIDLDQLYQEWDAQIKRVYQSGIIPSHLDSHHHTHTFGDNQEVVIALAKKYDLPVRGNFDKKKQVKHTSYFEPYFDKVGECEEENPSLSEYLDQLLVKLRQEESTEVMCHTAYIDQSLKVGSSFVFSRMKQVEFMIHSEFAKKVREDQEIECITYNEI